VRVVVGVLTVLQSVRRVIRAGMRKRSLVCAESGAYLELNSRIEISCGNDTPRARARLYAKLLIMKNV